LKVVITAMRTPLLVKSGSGGATFDVPDSAGVPADFARNTLTLR